VTRGGLFGPLQRIPTTILLKEPARICGCRLLQIRESLAELLEARFADLREQRIFGHHWRGGMRLLEPADDRGGVRKEAAILELDRRNLRSASALTSPGRGSRNDLALPSCSLHWFRTIQHIRIERINDVNQRLGLAHESCLRPVLAMLPGYRPSG